jgi:hypothetical protein
VANQVQIIVSAKDLATKTIQGVTQNLSNAAKVTDQFATSVSRMSIRAGIAFTGLQISAKKLLDIGSDAVELENVVVETFGSMAKEINAWADDIAAPMNRSNYQMREFAGMMGAMVIPIMRNKELATDMSKDLAELAVDMASFWNVADEETFNAIRSGLIGQIRPLQRFGISMTVASLQAFALEKGIKKSVQAMTESEKMHLRYQYLLEYTAIQQGDAARNADTYANILKGLDGDVRNTAEGFGLLMQPLGIELIRNLRDGVKWLGNLDDEVKMTIIRWGTFGTALLGGIAVFGIVTKAIAGFVKGLMLAGTAISLLTSPLVIKFALISTGIALVAHAWDENLGGIQDKTKSVVETVQGYLSKLHTWWHGVPAVTEEGITSGFEKDIPGMKHKLLDGWEWAINFGGDAWTWLTDTTWSDKVKDIKSWLTSGWDWAIYEAGDAWKHFTEETALGMKVEELRKKLTNSDLWKWTIDVAFPAVIEAGEAVVKAVVEAGGAMYDAIKTGLDTGDWGPFWSVASATWSKGVLIGLGLSSAVTGVAQAKDAVIAGLGIAAATAKATGIPGILGLLTVGIQLMEAKENDLGYEEFGKKLVLSLATGIGIGAFTGSPKVGALAFTIMMNLDWQWLKEPIDKAMEPVRQFLGTAPTEEEKFALEYRSADKDKRNQMVQDLNMPIGEFVNPPTWWERLLGRLGLGPTAAPIPDPIQIEIEPIPVGMEKFTEYMKKELGTMELPIDWRFPVAQWGLETGWGKALSAPFNLAGIKGTGPAGSVTQITREVIDGQEVTEEAQFAAFNNIKEFMEAYLSLLESSYALALEAQTIDEFTGGLLNGRGGRRWATDPLYQDLVSGTYRSIIAKGYSDGVILPGYGGGDRRPALLEDGEAVVPKEAVKGGSLGVVEWFRKMGVPGFKDGRVPSISIPGVNASAITDAEDTIAGMQTMFADLGNSVISGFATVFDVVFDVVENLAVKILGEEAVDSIKSTVEKGKERLQSLIDTLYPQAKKADEDDSGDEEEEVALSKWQEWHQNFTAVNKAQIDYVTDMSKLLQNFNTNAAKSVSNVQNFLDIVANFPTMLETVQGGFIGLQEQISALFGGGKAGAIAGRVGAGLAGWNAFSQGSTKDSTNWVGGIAGGLAGMGIGGPWTAGIAWGSQIIGSIFPGSENEDKATDEQLKKRIEGYNKQLEEWGASFQSDNLSFKADGGFLGWRHLFGNVKWETIGKDLAEKGAELAERLIRSMESIFGVAGQGLFDVLFNGADLADFSKVIGKQMQQTLMAEILNTAVIKEPLQKLSAYVAEAVEGGFDANELATIKEMMSDVYSAAEPYGDWAANISKEFGLAEESAKGLAGTMRNAPSGYKVDLTRWHATQGVAPTGGHGVTPRQWETNSGTRAVQIIVHGSINGVKDLKKTIKDAMDEYDREKGHAELAYSGVMA